MTAADAYAALVATRGAPPGEHVFRRIYAGRPLDDSRLVRDARGPAHYESREPPVDVPAGARWLTATSENLDGGPGLANRIAVLDLPHPHAVEDVAAIEAHWDGFAAAHARVAELHGLLEAWGTSTLRRIVWLSPRFRIEGMVGTIHCDVLGTVRSALHEIAEDYKGYSPADEIVIWQTLADRGEVWPRETDDTYYPGIRIASTWVGKPFAQTPSPLPSVAALEASGIRVAAICGDEAVLTLP